MKAFTDIEQSKKLAEILPIKTADMRYAPFGDVHPWFTDGSLVEKDSIPCWSLAALLDIIQIDYKIEKTLFDQTNEFTYSIWADNFKINTDECDDLIDACYEMILKLHEEKLL